jgi:hypothetical protein
VAVTGVLSDNDEAMSSLRTEVLDEVDPDTDDSAPASDAAFVFPLYPRIGSWNECSVGLRQWQNRIAGSFRNMVKDALSAGGTAEGTLFGNVRRF